jgi:hypothetical protein
MYWSMTSNPARVWDVQIKYLSSVQLFGGINQGNQIGRIFTNWVREHIGLFLTITEVAQIWGLLISTEKDILLILTKILVRMATFWAVLLPQTHPVTLGRIHTLRE